MNLEEESPESQQAAIARYQAFLSRLQRDVEKATAVLNKSKEELDTFTALDKDIQTIQEVLPSPWLYEGEAAILSCYSLGSIS